MKPIFLLVLLSLIQSSFAFEAGTMQASSTYEYKIAEVDVACVYAPNEEGEGPVYHFFKSDKAYQLSLKHNVLFPSNDYDCNDEIGGSDLLTLAMVNPFSNKKEKVSAIEQEGGFKKVQVIFWKEVKSEDIRTKLRTLF